MARPLVQQMCNEYVVQEIDGLLKWVRLAIRGGGTVVGDFDPDQPELVQFTTAPQHRHQVLPDGVGPVIRLGDNGRFEYLEMRWGFPPPPNAKPPRPVTNVRNLESSFWRKWLEPKHCCLVPVSTFCEWTDAPDPVTGTHLLHSFVTTEANEVVGAIHAKAMPAILTRDKWMDWLRAPADIAKIMVRPHDDEMSEPALAPN